MNRRDALQLVAAASLASCAGPVAGSARAGRLPGIPPHWALLVRGGPKSGYAVDAAAEVPKPAASLLKLLIALAAVEAVTSGAIGLEQPALPPGEHGGTLAAGDAAAWTVERLLRDMLTRSSNVAANALIKTLRPARINATAARLGLRTTRVHGYFADDRPVAGPNALTTARDVYALLLAMWTRSRARAREGRLYAGLVASLVAAPDGRLLRAVVPSEVVVAEKVGEISGVLNDAAIIDPYGDAPSFVVLLDDSVPAGADAYYSDELGMIRRVERAYVERARTPTRKTR